MSEQDNRPLSPHLQVYKPQITSVLSILHRIAGVFLSIGTVVLIGWLVAAATSAEAYSCAQDIIGSIIGQLALAGWTVCLFYHLFNGIRHLYWNTGRGFEMSSVTRSGILVIIATIACTAAVWVPVIMGGQ